MSFGTDRLRSNTHAALITEIRSQKHFLILSTYAITPRVIPLNRRIGYYHIILEVKKQPFETKRTPRVRCRVTDWIKFDKEVGTEAPTSLINFETIQL
jgi:hypothetical protein